VEEDSQIGAEVEDPMKDKDKVTKERNLWQIREVDKEVVADLVQVEAATPSKENVTTVERKGILSTSVHKKIQGSLIGE
jgi:hypothetical protein